MTQHVWIICDDEVYASKGSALKTIERLLIEGVKLLKNNTHHRTMDILLREDLELALAYWNAHCPSDEGGMGSPISLREAEVRP